MTPPNPYFMHDQVRHRVAQIMRGYDRTAPLNSPIWPVIAIIAVLTFINVMAVMPPT